jgi:N12 class adenine-specific DNA methylase
LDSTKHSTCCTFATGTPIMHSLTEMWMMQTYPCLDLLEDAHIADISE